jgi:putative phosphoesterase
MHNHPTGMRLAVVSDVHGNLTALDAVLADLRLADPDLVVYGGDFAYGGSRPAEVVDRIREMHWPAVVGNTDEMLWRPELLAPLVQGTPQLKPLFEMLFTEMAPACAAALGRARLAWLRQLPDRWSGHGLGVVHAAPGNLWRGAMPDATDEQLQAMYGPLGTPIVAYGHIHVPYVRRMPALTVANSGSVSLSYDGDPRASYLVVEKGAVAVRRVEYDVDAEIGELHARKQPHAEWTAAMLRAARYIPPA